MSSGYLLHKVTANVPSTIWFEFMKFVNEHELEWETIEIIEVPYQT